MIDQREPDERQQRDEGHDDAAAVIGKCRQQRMDRYRGADDRPHERERPRERALPAATPERSPQIQESQGQPRPIEDAVPPAEFTRTEHSWPDDFLVREGARRQDRVRGSQDAVSSARDPQRCPCHCGPPPGPTSRLVTIGFAGSSCRARSYWTRASRARLARRYASPRSIRTSASSRSQEVQRSYAWSASAPRPARAYAS